MYGTPAHVFRGVAKLDDRGRVLLPLVVRRDLGVKRGDQVMFVLVVKDSTPTGASIVVQAVKPHA